VLCLGAESLGSILAPANTGVFHLRTVLPDWSDYEQVHADRRNLSIHLLAVPLFAVAFPASLIFLFTPEFIPAIASLLAATASMVSQKFGHAKESIRPRPFTGPFDFLRRWFTEQYFIFPTFVLTGRWWRQYRVAGR
jgi:hypothetical protein